METHRTSPRRETPTFAAYCAALVLLLSVVLTGCYSAAPCEPAQHEPSHAQAMSAEEEMEHAMADVRRRFPRCRRTITLEETEMARNAHMLAVRAFENRLYEQALGYWIDAHRFDCSRPKVLLNVGEAFERLDEIERALAAYEILLERLESDDVPLYVHQRVQRLRIIVGATP